MSMKLAVALACLSCSGSVLADARIDYVVQGDCAVEPGSLRVSGSRLRVDHEIAGNRGSSLFDGLEETLVYLDHDQRTFSQVEIDIDAAEYTGDVASSSMKFVDKEMAKAQKQMEASCREMEKQGMACPQMGMDMQAMMEMAQGMAAAQSSGDAAAASTQGIDPQALMQGMNTEALRQQAAGGSAPAAPDLGALVQAPRPSTAVSQISDSGRDERVAGATCRWVEERRGDVLLSARCMATPDALPLSARDLAGLKRAWIALNRYGEAFTPIKQRFAPGSETPGFASGVVLAQRCYDQRGEPRGSAAATISQSPIDEESLEIPSGYQAMRMDGGGQ